MPRERVTEAELAVLQLLWNRSEAGIRELTDALYPDGGTSAYATVQKLLDRLQSKGFVDRRLSGRRNLFRPLVSRSELIVRRLQETADALCDGALSPLLTHLVQASDLDDSEVSELRRLVDELASAGVESGED